MSARWARFNMLSPILSMADNRQTQTTEREKLPLSKAVEYVLDECRMVLPGIQALLGFQLATEEFIIIATRLLISSMPLLAIGICLDFYLIAKVILGGAASGLVATGLFAVFVLLWFILPRVRLLQRLLLRRK